MSEYTSRLMAIQQASLEPRALSASGRERMVYGRAAASEDKRIDLAEETAWFGCVLNFGDILNMDGPLVEIGPRLVFDNNSVVGGWQYNQRGTVRARPDPRWSGVRREAWGVRRGASGVGRGAWSERVVVSGQ